MKMQLLNKCIECGQEIPFSFSSCGVMARHLRAVIVSVTFKWKWPIKSMSWYKLCKAKPFFSGIKLLQQSASPGLRGLRSYRQWHLHAGPVPSRGPECTWKGDMCCPQPPWPVCLLPSQCAHWSASRATAMSSRGGKKKSTKTSRSAKAGVIFPVGRMLRYIKKGHPKYRIGVGAPVYMAAVLEYLTGECTSVNPDTTGSDTEVLIVLKRPHLFLLFWNSSNLQKSYKKSTRNIFT